VDEPDIDIETFRRSRSARFISWLSKLAKEITHLGWRTTSATVVACRPVRASRYYTPSMREPYDPPVLTRYVVEFSYSVNNSTYTGVLDSPVQVEPNDQFDIRYNPGKPEENNSLGSDGNSLVLLSNLVLVLLGITLVLLLVRRFLPHW
jgi:hypothetical protein